MLSRALIVDRAIARADRDGIAAMSIRRLAAEFSVTPMALYWHFENKDALLDAMAERVAATLEFEDDRAASWQSRLRNVLGAILEGFSAHPWLPALVKGRIVAAPQYLATLETLLDAIRNAGYDEFAAVSVADFAVDSLAAMSATIASYARQPTAPEQSHLAATRNVDADIGPRYPRIGESAVPLTQPQGPDRYRQWGLDILVRGIEAAAPATKS
jgi:AcrR family transcriptional regulator